MVETALRQSPLAALGLAARVAQDVAKGDVGITMVERVDLSQIVLRGSPTEAFLEAASKGIGVSPPTADNTVAELPGVTRGIHVLWLGPNEWLVVTAPGCGPAIIDDIRGALADQFASVIDVSDARAVFRLSGPDARNVLMKGCTLDLHPHVFGPGQCAQTLLARAEVILHQTTFDRETSDATYDLYVLRSYAEYLWAWLEDAASEYGIKIDRG